MQRRTRVLSLPWGWLERQRNQKIIWSEGEKTPLAEEVGKDFYIRLPDNHCQEAQEWASPRMTFWTLSQIAWAEVLDGHRLIQVVPQIGGQPLFARLWALENDWFEKIQNDEIARSEALTQVQDLIKEYLK